MSHVIPKDPFMLLSYLNTQLRDYYPSLLEMCKALEINQKQIVDSLQAIGYVYDSHINQFVS